MIKHIIFDLDQTLVDTSLLEIHRKKREWKTVYSLINQSKVFEGIYELLYGLDSLGIEYSVLTNSPSSYCLKILEFHRIKVKFVVAYHDVKLRKPDPEGILLTLSKLNLNRNDVIHIGDQSTDILASINAKVMSVAAMWGTSNDVILSRYHPDFIALHPLEILEIIHNNQE